jgi:hypothetical protein
VAPRVVLSSIELAFTHRELVFRVTKQNSLSFHPLEQILVSVLQCELAGLAQCTVPLRTDLFTTFTLEVIRLIRMKLITSKVAQQVSSASSAR